jgi:hypothetical protein
LNPTNLPSRTSNSALDNLVDKKLCQKKGFIGSQLI